MYKTEELCRTVIERLTNKYFPTCRPVFLQNPRTGRNLEFDGYNHELKIAFERQGEQHYEYNTGRSLFKDKYINGALHKTGFQQWKEQIQRDIYKQTVCRVLGIELIIIPPQVKTEEQITLFITEHLKKKNLNFNKY